MCMLSLESRFIDSLIFTASLHDSIQFTQTGNNVHAVYFLHMW